MQAGDGLAELLYGDFSIGLIFIFIVAIECLLALIIETGGELLFFDLILMIVLLGVFALGFLRLALLHKIITNKVTFHE